jgi:hypothetical protein
VLKVSDESFEFGLLTQTLEMWIDQEERPAGKALVDAALEPGHRLFRFAKHGVNGGDLMMGVMCVAERNRELERLPHTIERGAGFMAPGVQYALSRRQEFVLDSSFYLGTLD